MKTLQELYKEVIGSEELKKEFMEASKDEKSVEEFLKKKGCDATFEELKAFFEEKGEGELDEDEVEAVAGGKLDTEDPLGPAGFGTVVFTTKGSICIKA